MNKLIHIHGENISNQQRFPKSLFGWPLFDVAKLIIDGNPNWCSFAESRIQKLIDARQEMQSLADLYNCRELEKWPIGCAFIPWFSSKPLLSNTIYDHDYTEKTITSKKIIDSLCKLISSIEQKGFVNLSKRNSILGYPLNRDDTMFYIRAGNHRAAVLSALEMEIPIFIDKITYLKPRSIQIISQKKWILGPKKVYEKYPLVDEIQNWPVVCSKIISLSAANSIYSSFINNNNN